MREMSSKASILQRIENATRAHRTWIKHVDRLVNGIDGFRGEKVTLQLDKKFIEQENSALEFEEWINTYSIHLARIPTIGRFIQRIEQHHNQLNETYADIYKIFFIKPQNRPLMYKILTLNNKKISSVEREQAKIYFKYLVHSSNELLEVMSILEEKIKSLNYSELQKVFDGQ